MPYPRQTEGVLRSKARLKPETLAVMHGSSYLGQADCSSTNGVGLRQTGRSDGEWKARRKGDIAKARMIARWRFPSGSSPPVEKADSPRKTS